MINELFLAETVIQLPPGQRVLVTGASGGLGRATLQLLAHSPDIRIGAHYYQNRQKLLDLLNESSNLHSNTRLFQADLTNAVNAKQLVSDFVSWTGGIDILIQLSGGIVQSIAWNELDEVHWQADINLNLTAPFFLAQTAMNLMGKHGGKIILVSTASAQHGGGANSMAYGVAKAGIECVTKGLARVGAPYNITVNAVSPGFIETEFHTTRMHRTADQLRHRASLVPLKRAGTPYEVAGLVVFLASPLASYITGEIIAVSGGDWL